MKAFIIGGIILLVGVVSDAVAGGCENAGYTQRLSRQQIENQLSGKRVLATGGGEEWHEDHCTSGALYKVGKGPTDPVDPRAFRGTWEARAGGGQNPPRVEYKYTVGGSSQFVWTVWRNQTTNGLCWEDLGGAVIATGSKPVNSAGSPCNVPSN